MKGEAPFVIPAKAGIQQRARARCWIPDSLVALGFGDDSKEQLSGIQYTEQLTRSEDEAIRVIAGRAGARYKPKELTEQAPDLA